MLKSVNWCTRLNCLMELFIILPFVFGPQLKTCHAIFFSCSPWLVLLSFHCHWHWTSVEIHDSIHDDDVELFSLPRYPYELTSMGSAVLRTLHFCEGRSDLLKTMAEPQELCLLKNVQDNCASQFPWSLLCRRLLAFTLGAMSLTLSRKDTHTDTHPQPRVQTYMCTHTHIHTIHTRQTHTHNNPFANGLQQLFITDRWNKGSHQSNTTHTHRGAYCWILDLSGTEDSHTQKWLDWLQLVLWTGLKKKSGAHRPAHGWPQWWSMGSAVFLSCPALYFSWKVDHRFVLFCFIFIFLNFLFGSLEQVCRTSVIVRFNTQLSFWGLWVGVVSHRPWCWIRN